MRQTPATEAIALLIDLAQRGEINPWDVQVIEVIDRYLSELALGNKTESGSIETDLSQSGQAFLWASMLVLLKADTLGSLEEPEELEIGEVEEELDGIREPRLSSHLERHLRRRQAAPPPKRRSVTLGELIEQLQQMALQLAEAPAAKNSRQRRSMSRTQAAKVIAQLAHDENLTETAARLEEFLCHNWQEISAGKDWLNLDQLLEWWTMSTAKPDQLDLDGADDHKEPPTHDRVGVFWALLLLSAQSKVELYQEEFYQDLKIRTLE